jgi:hypothetical protein
MVDQPALLWVSRILTFAAGLAINQQQPSPLDCHHPPEERYNRRRRITPDIVAEHTEAFNAAMTQPMLTT